MNAPHFFSPALTWQMPGSEPAAQSELPDVSRQQLAMLTEISCALFRCSEAMRKIQQQAAHHASLRHEAAMKKLRAHCTTADLLDIQSELLHFDMERASQYWQQLAAVAMQTPVEIMTSVSHLRDSPVATSLSSTLNAFQAALPLVNGFFPSRHNYAIE
jgi:hypothetical protein